MAILEQGLVGTFTGKMGAIVVSKWKNVYVGKSKPKKSSKPASQKQADQRSKFALVGGFINYLPNLVVIGFKGTEGITSMNEAMQYNLNNAVSGVYPNYKLDYANVGLSNPKGRGGLDGALASGIAAVAGNSIKVTWQQEVIPSANTKPTDTAHIIIYNAVKDVFSVGERLRSSLTYDITLPRLLSGELHCWLFFSSENKRFVSATEYLGTVTTIA